MSIFKRTGSSGFGTGSPHARSKQIKEIQQQEMRKHIENTMVEIRARTHLQSGSIQNAIEQIRRIDRIKPIDHSARRRACQMLRMYLGQYRVLQLMRDHVETIYSEIEMREITQEFGHAINEFTDLIHTFDRRGVTMPQIFARMRKALGPIHSEDRLKQYDDMYRGLIDLYPETQTDADGINDEWLEGVVAGTISWDSVPETANQQTARRAEELSQHEVKEDDFRSLMDSISSALKGDK